MYLMEFLLIVFVMLCQISTLSSSPIGERTFGRVLFIPPEKRFEDFPQEAQRISRKPENNFKPIFNFEVSFPATNKFLDLFNEKHRDKPHLTLQPPESRYVKTNFDTDAALRMPDEIERSTEHVNKKVQYNEVVYKNYENNNENKWYNTEPSDTETTTAVDSASTYSTDDYETTTFPYDDLLRSGVSGNVVASLLG